MQRSADSTVILAAFCFFLMESTQATEQFSCHVLRSTTTMFSEKKIQMSKAGKCTCSVAQFTIDNLKEIVKRDFN